MNGDRTEATLLTPLGRGAVATIGIRGPQASTIVARYFSPSTSAYAAINQIRFGRWCRAEDSAGEELVICRTHEQAIEIHCHGGRAAVESILTDLQSAGAVRVDARQWLHHAVQDPLAAAALIALADARTERTAAILLDQYRGALSQELRTIQSLLGPKTRDSALARIERLRQWIPVGLHLTSPFRVVLAGPPNVGKSSLINALLGYDRSIVFDQPGTTRDVVSAVTAFDGWPVELSDTAGIRAATDVLEAAGIERASQQLVAADLVLWVMDATAAQPELPPVGTTVPLVLVHNKIDALPEPYDLPGDCHVSAKTGTGRDALQGAIVRALVPHAPLPGAAVPFLPEHVALLDDLWRHATSAEG